MAKKGKEKYDDVNNLFVGATLCEEVQEENNKEDPEEWLGDSGALSHINHKNKDMRDAEKGEINVTVGNGQNMKCELKGSVNMKLKYVKTVKLNKVLYETQAVKNLLAHQGLSQRAPRWGALRIK